MAGLYKKMWIYLQDKALEKQRLSGDLTAACQHLQGAYKRAGEEFFLPSMEYRTRGNGFKLKENRFRLDVRKRLFIVRVILFITLSGGAGGGESVNG